MTDLQGHIFIIGSPRSGTSVLHWSLCRSPQLWGRGESMFLVDLAQAVPKAWERGQADFDDAWLAAENVDRSEFFQAAGRGITELVRSRAGDARWVDQTPAYTHVAGELAEIFPDSRFLAIFRDGRQAIPSIQKLRKVSFSWAAAIWSQSCRLALDCMANIPERCLPVCYEALVLEPEDTLREIFEFLEEPFCEDSALQITDSKPINSSFENEDRLAKLQPRWTDWNWLQRRQFKRHSKGMLERLGYEADGGWRRRVPKGRLEESEIRETIARVRTRLESERRGS